MKIVKRSTFMAMPAGTVFQKFDAEGVARALCIKGETVLGDDNKPIDWFYTELTGDDCAPALVDLHKGGEGGYMPQRCRDGEFYDGDTFLVYSQADLAVLLKDLQDALALVVHRERF